MKTELCDVLGIEYPIIQGAMAHISDGKFAATVSEAGGLGVIASTLHDGQWVKEQVEIARSITDKPFAVNLIMESDIVEECARMCVELKVPICTISAGNPEKIVPILVEGGIKVICLIPHARAAKKMQDLGATAVVAEGMEGGGTSARCARSLWCARLLKRWTSPLSQRVASLMARDSWRHSCWVQWVFRWARHSS